MSAAASQSSPSALSQRGCYDLTIPEVTPSLNSTMRRHWSHGYHAKNRWAKLVRDALLQTYEPPYRAFERARVTVTRFSPWPIHDVDNLYGGCKALLDALVANGLLVDDSAEHIELKVQQAQFERKPKRTQVLIEAV